METSMSNPTLTQTNFYSCTQCTCKWDDQWDCGCDDECPQCGTVMTPYKQEPINDRGYVRVGGELVPAD